MMHKLLEDVLGTDGAAALSKAVHQAPALGDVLLPRTALSWARMAVKYGYDGYVPGCPQACLMTKSEGGWVLTVDGTQIEGAGDARLASVLLVLSGITSVGQAAGPDLARLGKSLDVLAQSVWVRKLRDIQAAARQRSGLDKAAIKPMGGGGGTAAAGPAHAPTKPVAATPPTPTQAAQGAPGKAPKAPKPKAATFARAEMEAPCGVCGRSQMRQGQVVGCMCFTALVKSAKWTVTPVRVSVLFDGEDWTPDAITTFAETVRNADAR